MGDECKAQTQRIIYILIRHFLGVINELKCFNDMLETQRLSEGPGENIYFDSLDLSIFVSIKYGVLILRNVLIWE